MPRIAVRGAGLHYEERGAGRIHARIAGSRLHVLQGAGHTSTIEEPAAVNAAIADFLAGLR